MIIIGPFTLFLLLMLFCKPVRKFVGFMLLLTIVLVTWHSVFSG